MDPQIKLSLNVVAYMRGVPVTCGDLSFWCFENADRKRLYFEVLRSNEVTYCDFED